MKKLTGLLFLILPITLFAKNYRELKLIYHEPAQKITQALPLGNGRLGATVFGGINQEKLLLNDDTFWSGEPKNWDNPASPTIVPKIHEALVNGDHQMADQLAQKIQGPYNQSYQPLGEVILTFDHPGTPVNYIRSLDLQKAVANVSYTVDGTKFNRSVFSSYPDQVVVVLLEANRPGKLSFNVKLDGKHQRISQIIEGNLLESKGKAPAHVDPSYLDTKNPVVYAETPDGKGMNYATFVKIETHDGTVSANGSEISIKNATKVTLYISARTSYNGFDKSPSAEGVDCETLAKNDLLKLGNKNFQQLLKVHVSDYQKLFNRVDLQLGEDSKSPASVKEYLERLRKNNDPQMLELVFQMGRYLTICGSRPGSQPLNLQGIWNEWVRPPWSSNYTLNINAQMNYWPVMATNLAECHEPMLKFIEELAVNGTKTAKVNYGCNGWVVHHNADLWRQSAPVGDFNGDPCWANFMGGGIWESFDFWEHYQFTQDLSFLKKRAYPLFKGAVEFSLDWLKKDEEGYLAPPFTVSSEANYITPSGYKGSCALNTGQDIALYGELFVNFIKTCEILNMKDGLYLRTKDALSHLAPYQIDPEGKIKEWLEEGVDRPNGGNKNHLSHLIGFYPGRHLIFQNNQNYVNAVKRTLEIFGPSTAGWMFAWEINLWARLKDSEQAYGLIKRLAERFGPNDFNPDGAYQIDWQMGYTAGICEMLVQSHNVDENGNTIIELLPALPKEWPSGHVYGLITRGGFEVNIEWENGLVTKSIIQNVCNNSSSAPKIVVIANGKRIIKQIPIHNKITI